MGIYWLALRRVARNGRLLATAFVGIVAAIALVGAIPLYTNGILERLLHAGLVAAEGKPPGAVTVKAIMASPESRTPERYRQLDALVREQAEAMVGLPRRSLVRYTATDIFILLPVGADGVARDVERRYATLASQADFAEHVTIVEGEALPADPVSPGAAVPAIASTSAAVEMHLRVGDRFVYRTFDPDDPSAVPVEIVGIWEARDPDDRYWLTNPYEYTNTLFVREADLLESVVPRLPKSLKTATWYAEHDLGSLHIVNAGAVSGGLAYLEAEASRIVPGTAVETTLRTSLAEYLERGALLNTLMLALAVPTIAVVLFYVATSIGMVVERQRGEIALLKSRGASTRQIVGLYAAETSILAVGGIVVGLAVSVGLALAMGQAYGFLQFAKRPPLPVMPDEMPLQLAVAAALLSVPAALQPTVAAARRSIVTYKHEASRSGLRMLAHGLYLDVVLLAIAGYAYSLLREHKSILPLGKDGSFVVDPMLVLVPAAFILGGSVFLVRLYPLIATILVRLAERLPGPTIGLAARHVARAPSQHAVLVLLLTLTLALGTYSASIAQTIDRNLAERIRYDVPADLEVWEGWEYDEEQRTFFEPPFERHLVPGVVAAAAYKQYQVVPRTGRSVKAGRLLALDRLAYPAVGWWRPDFASRPLGALMNALGANPAATLVSRGFVEASGLQLGDPYSLSFGADQVTFYVAEVVDYFPTLYPEKGPFFVANIDYVANHIGSDPYRVWLKIDPAYRSAEVVDALRARELNVVNIRDSRLAVTQGKADPQRTGLFGVLTVGFVVAAFLTVLGFLAYAWLSFERRVVQLGVLRVLGLSGGQLRRVLLFEQASLIALGILLGTGLGLAASAIFVPFLQVQADGQTPRFVVETAWTDVGRVYLVLGLALLVGQTATAWLVRHLRLDQVVKLGEE